MVFDKIDKMEEYDSALENMKDDSKNMNLDSFDQSESDAVSAPLDGQKLVSEIKNQENKLKDDFSHTDKEKSTLSDNSTGINSDMTSLKKRFMD